LGFALFVVMQPAHISNARSIKFALFIIR